MNTYEIRFKTVVAHVIKVKAEKVICHDYSMYTFYDVNGRTVFMAGALDVLYVRKVENE